MTKESISEHEYCGHNLLVIHVVEDDSVLCGELRSKEKENRMVFERFVQINMNLFAENRKRKTNESHFLPQIYPILKKSSEPWVLLLQGNIGVEKDFPDKIRRNLISSDQRATIFTERSAVDRTTIYMPERIKHVPYDVLGKFPSNLLIRKALLEEVLLDPRGIFLPNPILGILRILLNKGIEIAGSPDIGVIHNGPMNCSIAQCGMSEWNQKSNERKRILIITHELTRTGAPIVLQEACINVMKPAGYELYVVSPVEGPMLQAYRQANIPVMIMPSLLNKELPHISMLAELFDLVIANTIVMWPAVCVLNTMDIPVMWWIHDAESGYKWVAPYMPKKLKSNIYVYCVGGYAKEALTKHLPDYQNIQTLIYGIKDQGAVCVPQEKRNDKQTVFVCVGSLEERKGQDILCRAIELLPQNVRKGCLFKIVGKAMQKDIYLHVEKTCKKYPEQIEYAGEVAREKVYQMYRQADCVICASRDDPMPTFVAEGMMFSTPSICSENTGTAKVLKQGIDGFVYKKNDPAQLADAIQAFIRMTKEEQAEISAEARRTFLREFELEQFRKKFIDAIEFCMNKSEDTGKRTDK